MIRVVPVSHFFGFLAVVERVLNILVVAGLEWDFFQLPRIQLTISSLLFSTFLL